jgi:hypothetical protein
MNAGKFSSRCTIGSFSRRAQLHEWVSEWFNTYFISPCLERVNHKVPYVTRQDPKLKIRYTSTQLVTVFMWNMSNPVLVIFQRSAGPSSSAFWTGGYYWHQDRSVGTCCRFPEVYRGSSNNQAENWCRHLFLPSRLPTTQHVGRLCWRPTKRNET